jgi:hypothetical protein
MSSEPISDTATDREPIRFLFDRAARGGTVVGVVAAALMVVATFLPWFVVTKLTSAGEAVPGGSLSISWLDHREYAQSWINIMIPAGTAGCMLASVLGFARSSWAVWLAACAAYLVALAGVLLQLSRINDGLLDPPGFSVTTSGLGLWLYAAAAAVGAISSGLGLVIKVTGRAERR